MQPHTQATKKFVYMTLVTLHFRVTNVSAVLRAEQSQKFGLLFGKPDLN